MNKNMGNDVWNQFWIMIVNEIFLLRVPNGHSIYENACILIFVDNNITQESVKI